MEGENIPLPQYHGFLCWNELERAFYYEDPNNLHTFGACGFGQRIWLPPANEFQVTHLSAVVSFYSRGAIECGQFRDNETGALASLDFEPTETGSPRYIIHINNVPTLFALNHFVAAIRGNNAEVTRLSTWH